MPLAASVQETGIHRSPAKPNCHVGTVLSVGPHWSPVRSLPAARRRAHLHVRSLHRPLPIWECSVHSPRGSLLVPVFCQASPNDHCPGNKPTSTHHTVLLHHSSVVLSPQPVLPGGISWLLVYCPNYNKLGEGMMFCSLLLSMIPSDWHSVNHQVAVNYRKKENKYEQF